MSSGIQRARNRVGESHHPGGIRETSLSRERADDERHSAELEGLAGKHKDKSRPPQDTLDLHHQGRKNGEEGAAADPSDAAAKSSKRRDNGHPHLDVRA